MGRIEVLFMVIETFQAGKKAEVYARFEQRGRMLPEGLTYLDSWVESEGDRCFQIMSTEDEALFETWIANWDDLIDFEVIPVAPSPTKSISEDEKK